MTLLKLLRGIAIVGAFLAGCGSGGGPMPDAAIVADGGACSYGGSARAPGSRFRAVDGCNECACAADGEVLCTDRAECRDGGGGGSEPMADAAANDAGTGFPDAPDGRPAMDAAPLADGGTLQVLPDPTPCWKPIPGNPRAIDIGHAMEITLLRFSGNRILSADIEGRWNLWNAETRERIMSGDRVPLVCGRTDRECMVTRWAYVDLRGNTLAVTVATGLELRDARDGTLKATVTPEGRRLELSGDGSYLWNATASRLVVWSADGRELFSTAGDYSTSVPFAAAGELRVRNGPAGARVIETFDLAGVRTVSSPFEFGAFFSWFLDGERFLTTTGNTAWVYPRRSGSAIAVLGLMTTQGLGGNGDNVWAGEASSALTLYRISTPGSPVVVGRVGHGVHHGDRLAVLGTDGKVVILRLRESGPVTELESYVAPYLAQVAMNERGEWVAGNRDGVIKGSPTGGLPFGCGNAWTMWGSETGILAMGTAAAGVVLAQLSSDSIVPRGRIPFISSQVQISAAGDILAASATSAYAQYASDRTLVVVSLAGGLEMRRWPSAYPAAGSPTLWSFALASGGGRLARTVCCQREGWDGTFVNQLPSGNDDFAEPLKTPGLRSVIAPTEPILALAEDSECTTTRVFRSGVLVTAVPGCPVVWLDDGRLLVQRSVFNNGTYTITSAIHDGSGRVLATPVLPLMDSAIALPGGAGIYSLWNNSTYDANTGAVRWTGSVMVQRGARLYSYAAAIVGGSVALRDRWRVVFEPIPRQ